MAKRRTATPKKRSDVLKMLEDDHKRVKKLFKQFEKCDDDAEGKEIAERACAELEVHTRIEEELVYPAIRAGIEQTDLLDEAKVEHESAKDLIRKLRALRPSDAEYVATFTVLGEYVLHHVQEEEDEMFPKARRAKIDFDALANRVEARRTELMGEVGLSPATSGRGRGAASGERTGARMTLN